MSESHRYDLDDITEALIGKRKGKFDPMVNGGAMPNDSWDF